MRLAGKVAIVTGGASGIGLATARRFAAEGATVAIADLDGEAASAAAASIAGGEHLVGVRCDVSSGAEVGRVLDLVVGRFGTVDVLHANAGMPFAGPIEDVTAEILNRVIAVNLKGAFLCAQAVVPLMKERRSGAIIFTASLQAIGARPNFTPYTAAKHGVVGLMKGLALELAPWGIRVNAIAPGPTDTPMLRRFSPGMADDKDAGVDRFREGIPLGRLVSPDDVAAAALYLASDDAAMVTGHVLVVDGGVTAG